MFWFHASFLRHYDETKTLLNSKHQFGDIGADGEQNAIDANINTNSNDDFEWISTGAFSSTAGEMRYEQTGNDTFIQGDIDGDGQADMMIRLTGLYTLSATDIIGVSDLQPNSAPASPSLSLDYAELFAESASAPMNIAGIDGEPLGKSFSGAMSPLAGTPSAVSMAATSDNDMLSDAVGSEGPAGFAVAPAAAFEGEGSPPRLDPAALFDAPMPEAISLYVDNVI